MTLVRTAGLLAALFVCIGTIFPGAAASAETEPAAWTGPTYDASAPRSHAPRLYVLSFTDADIGDVAGAVLGTTLGLPFDFDPALQGRMSLHVDERMTPDQLMEAFSRSLTAAGGAVVTDDGKLRLMPTTRARRLAQMAKRARYGIDRHDLAAAAPAARLIASPNANPRPVSPEPGPPLVWIAISALFGGLIALATMSALSRFKVGQFGSPSAKRDAVIDRLLQQTPIDAAALADARRLAAESRQPLEQTLHQMGRISDDALVGAYAAVTGCAIWRPDEQPALIGRDAFGSAPDCARRRGLVPIVLDTKHMVLAALDPLDDEAIAAAAAAAKRPVTILVGAPRDIRAALYSM